MTANQFRKLALKLPEAVESSHMNHPDFRVRGKIFATLGPSEAWGMVKLTPDQQKEQVRAHPESLTPVKGGWGRKGATQVMLETAKADAVEYALTLAWRNAAPKNLAEEA